MVRKHMVRKRPTRKRHNLPLVRASAKIRSPQAASADGEAAGALYRLMAWLSPAYPVGAFSYSSGIEWAVEASDIKDRESLRRWLAVVIGQGAGFCDAVFFVHSHAAALADDGKALRADLASMLHETQYTRLFRS